MKTTNNIPELSFIDIENGDALATSLLSEALNSHGFFSITHHGLPQDVLDSCYKSSRDFFNLPDSVKSSYHDPSLKGARGYTPFGIETAVGESVADLKEFWHHGPIIDNSYSSKIPKNIDIKELSDFNKNFDLLFNELHVIGTRVLRVIAQSIGVDKNFFDSWTSKGNSLLRPIHYPPVENTVNIHRARAHEDINLITLLVGAEEGGLEVLNKNDEWIKVQPSSNSIVCNIGDMMQLVTANKLKSTTHRVVQYVENEPTSRYSIPFFMHPSPETDLRNIFIEGSEGTLADDFLNERLKAIKLY